MDKHTGILKVNFALKLLLFLGGGGFVCCLVVHWKNFY